MNVMVWFYNHRDALNPLMDEKIDDQDEESDDDDDGDSDDEEDTEAEDRLDQVIPFLAPPIVVVLFRSPIH